METSKSNKITMAVIIVCIVALVVGYELLNSNKNECVMNISNQVEEQEVRDTIEVYVVGCVNKPGVYEVLKGSTIEKVAKEAGGFTKEADLERINLVHRLKDNVMLEIKSKSDRILAEKEKEREKREREIREKEKKENKKSYTIKKDSDIKKSFVVKKENDINNLSMKITKGMYEEENEEGDLQVNINTASKEEFSKLPGIGSSVAEKIIKYREQNGEFESIDDLKNISGIGENKFNAIKDMLVI